MIKTILITFSATLSALALAANLFLNSILGAFGLVATSIDNLSQLQASQKVVQTMKKRHTQRKSRVTKRFVKRSGKRVASTALAAATVGTVAVAAVVTTMAISDHCGEKRLLQEDGNVFHGTSTAFDLDRCLGESADDAEQILASATEEVQAKASGAFDATAQYSQGIWDDIKSATSRALDYTDSTFADLWNSATSWFAD